MQTVSKYNALRQFLNSQTSSRIELTFAQIEQIIGHELPPSAYAARWWTNGKRPESGPLWQQAWRGAGYDAMLMRGLDRVTFRRMQ